MPQILGIDLETYSPVPLPKTGVYRYVDTPEFQILLCSYCYDDGPVQTVDLAMGETLPESFIADLENPEIIGYTPQLVCATWIGDRYNHYASSEVNCNNLFKTFMDAALSGTAIESFPSYTAPTYNHQFTTDLMEGVEEEEKDEKDKKDKEGDENKKDEEA